jgi:hypothetical protein
LGYIARRKSIVRSRCRILFVAVAIAVAIVDALNVLIVDQYDARGQQGQRQGSAAGGTIGIRQVLAAADSGIPVIGGRVIVGGGNPPCRTTGVGTVPIAVMLYRKPNFDNSLTVVEWIV